MRWVVAIHPPKIGICLRNQGPKRAGPRSEVSNMVKKKRASKRVGLKMKFQIEKKVKNHKRKQRKLEKLNPHKKLKKDPGIPNLWPFKEDLLRKLNSQHDKEVASEQEQRARRNRELKAKRQLAQRLAQAVVADPLLQQQQEKEERRRLNEEEAFANANEQNRYGRWYVKELQEVVERSDVILEVLDARDPMGCRALDVEKRVLMAQSASGQNNKRVILVLNKVDLVPRQAMESWLKYLRREFPCIAFKSSTSHSKGSIGQAKVETKHASESQLAQSSALGASTLLQMLKNYARSHNIKTAITVGVIGYPNVGKSSVINSLKRQRAVAVGAQAGVTKALQLVKLDKNIALLDSPGVLFSASKDDEGLLLRNCLKPSDISDPLAVALQIVSKCSVDMLCELFAIARYTSAEECVQLTGLKRGLLAKGGVVNMEAAARSIIQDWNVGKVPFYCLPPETKDVVSSEVVSEWSKEFDLDSFMGGSDKALASELDSEQAAHGATKKKTEFLVLDPSKPVGTRWDEMEDEEEEGDEEEEQGEEEDEEEKESDEGVEEQDEEEEGEEEEEGDSKGRVTGQKRGRSAPEPAASLQPERRAAKKQQKKLQKDKRRAVQAMLKEEAGKKTQQGKGKDNTTRTAGPAVSSAEVRPYGAKPMEEEGQDDDAYNFATDWAL